MRERSETTGEAHGVLILRLDFGRAEASSIKGGSGVVIQVLALLQLLRHTSPFVQYGWMRVSVNALCNEPVALQPATLSHLFPPPASRRRISFLLHPARFAPTLVIILTGGVAFSTPVHAQAQPAPITQSSAQTPQPSQSSAQPTEPEVAPPSGTHTVTVTFNYDFSRIPSCAPKPAKRCVQQFNVYDISSGGKRHTKLFSISAMPGETKMVRGITGKSTQLALEPGKHQLAVTAQMATGSESAVDASTTWVEIPAPQTKSATPVN